MSFAALPIPEDFNPLKYRSHMVGTAFDNKDATIDLAKLEELEKGPEARYAGHYTLLMWFAHVFREPGSDKWYEVVKHKGSFVGYYEADTPEELMLGVNQIYENEKYGYNSR